MTDTETVRLATDVRLRPRVIVRAAKYLFAVRDALPRSVQRLVAVTVAVKIATAPLPVDGGLDELLIVITAAVLFFRHRQLLHVCVRAAQLDEL